ncbi:AAA family ATPase, partial [Gellertiella hungarica]
MFISKISELKNAGVWRDFTASPDLTIGRDTLIYGFNGSGKTTLSRVFASMQAGCLDSRLPPATTFKVETSDGSVVTQSMNSNPFGHNLLVFNSDCQRRSKNRPLGGAKVGHLGARMRPAGGRSPSG